MKVLAKKGASDNPDGEVGPWTHTQDVLWASNALFGEKHPTMLIKAWFRFFKVGENRWEEFRLLLKLACLWHDIGKATCSFQEMIHNGVEQIVRHEYLSLLLYCDASKHEPALKAHLVPLLHTIVGHHLKSGDGYYLNVPEQDDGTIQVFTADEGVQKILSATATTLCLDNVPTLTSSLDARKATAERTWDKLFVKGAFRRKIDEDANFFRALALALIVSDAAGSALRRTGLPLREWITSCFPQESLLPEALRKTIIDGRIQAIETIQKSTFTPNTIQRTAANLGKRAVLISPCGSGKTLAAYLWAEKQLKEHKASRIIFLYPTRNTATEGFRDYVSWGLDDSALIHGTSEFDIQGMSFNGDEPANKNKPSYNRNSRHQVNYLPESTLYALGYWNRCYISATVDTFLSFTANRYSADCLLPLLCDSILVVDEVHALDRRMFRHLYRFLEECDLPVLMMTATLPPSRHDDLKRINMPIDDGGNEAQQAASRPRYSISFSQEELLKNHIRSWLTGSKKRLLIVRNQVSTCQSTARLVQQLVEEISSEKKFPVASVLVYHSRFKLKDRQARHEEVIQKFKLSSKRHILVSTQVCQMSLDLDTESLYSELAPLADLIQRMGRANRHGNFERAEVVVFKGSKVKPYEPQELEEAQRLLSALPDPANTSQLHLAELISRSDREEVANQQTVALFDSLPRLESQPYREVQEFAVDALLDHDINTYLSLDKSQQPGLIVPVPFYETSKAEERELRYLRIASGEKYSHKYGYGEHNE